MDRKIYNSIKYDTKKLIKKQLFPSIELERICFNKVFEEALASNPEITLDGFMSLLFNDAMILFSNEKFRDECTTLGLVPNTISIHVAFDGKTYIEKVLEIGLVETYKKDLILVKRVFFSWEELQDANKRYLDEYRRLLQLT